MKNLSRSLLVGHVMGATAPTGLSRRSKSPRYVFLALGVLTLFTIAASQLLFAV